MKTDMQKLWKERRCPILNGIFFGDGRVVLMDVQPPEGLEDSGYSVTVVNRLTLSALEAEKEIDRTLLAQLCQTNETGIGSVLIGGEGGMGADGFVAVVEVPTNRLKWLAFFDCSNPFEQVFLDHDVVTGVTNRKHTWRFPLENPDELTITK